MKAYPMKLIPVPKEIVWGGNRLKTKYNKQADFEKIAESWELTVRDRERSVIENGEYAGMELNEYLEMTGHKENFPLLIKFIDAEDKLSVQVHPDESTDENGNSVSGKTEMWYIIEAAENSEIVYGIKDGYTENDINDAAGSERIESMLKSVKVKKGDSFFIPAGQIHAIGKGILIAEIQENSDTTYRMYDYGRKDINGNQRPLHIKEAANAIVKRTDAEINELRFSKGFEKNCLANCEKFKVEILQGVISQTVTDEGGFTALTCIDGGGYLRYYGEDLPIVAGDTYYIPEKCGTVIIHGNLTVLKSTVPAEIDQ